MIFNYLITLLSYPSSDSPPNLPLTLFLTLSQLLFLHTSDTAFHAPAQPFCSPNPCYRTCLGMEGTFDQMENTFARMVQLCIVVKACIFALLMEGNYKLGEVAYTIVVEKLVEAGVFDFQQMERTLDSGVEGIFDPVVGCIFDPEVVRTFDLEGARTFVHWVACTSDQRVEGIFFLQLMKV